MHELLENTGSEGASLQNGITIAIDPVRRPKYIDYLLFLDGLSHIQEDACAAYCPISLTLTPNEVKPVIARRQETLKHILQQAGLKAYDPATAPYSPDRDLSTQPSQVYLVDSGKIVGARFFVGHNILPSTGDGVESQKAAQFNRIPVILLDKRIRVSRMQPHRSIYLQYDDFEAQAGDFVKVFELLKKYEPGMGFHNGIPVLLGFDETGKTVDLEETVYTVFPQLQYQYDGTVPILQLRAENPQLFYEKMN